MFEKISFVNKVWCDKTIVYFSKRNHLYDLIIYMKIPSDRFFKSSYPIYEMHAFLKATLFSTQPQCSLTSSWIELQMLLRRSLIHITIILLRPILYLVFFCPCLGLGLFMSYLCDLLFIFSLIFIVINYITSLKQTHLFFVYFLEYLLFFWMKTWIKKGKNFQIEKVQP